MAFYLTRLGCIVSRSVRDVAGFRQTNLAPKSNLTWCQLRYFVTEKPKEDDRELVRVDYFNQVENRTKDTYLEMVNIYKSKERLRRGHVEFIYSALKHMKDFGVEKDLDVYKSLIDVFPKGKMIPRNIFQVEFMHYPKHQQCAIDLLEQMEENGIIPDWDMEDQLVNVFGNRGYPVRRYWRMMYWMPKWKNASPFPLPRPLPSDNLQLAKLAIERITEVDMNSQITVFKTSSVEDSVDDTWIVSGQSDDQRELLDNLPENSTLFVEGEFRIWLRNMPISYFILRTAPPIPPSPSTDEPQQDDKIRVFGMWSHPKEIRLEKQHTVHEQDDGTIIAVCATGTSSKDSLLSWLRCLQKSNPRLLSTPILFKLATSCSPSDPELAALDQPTASLPHTS